MKKLDKYALFTKQSNQLIKKSPYKKRIEKLLQDEMSGTENYEDDKAKTYYGLPSNCFGTIFYTLGIMKIDRPVFVSFDTMESFLYESCIKIKENQLEKIVETNFLIEFRDRDNSLHHVALYLGKTGEGQAIFHQPQTGYPYCVDELSLHLRMYPKGNIMSYYKPKKDIKIPREFR